MLIKRIFQTLLGCVCCPHTHPLCHTFTHRDEWTRTTHPLLVPFRDLFVLPDVQLVRLEYVCRLIHKSRRLVTEPGVQLNRNERNQFLRLVYQNLRPSVSLRRLYCLLLLDKLPEDLLQTVLWFTG